MSEPLDALEQTWRATKSPEAASAYVVALLVRLGEAPTDTRTRLRLGMTLYDLGETHGAIPELQRAKVGPAERPEAGYYLGLCFVKLRVARLAITELEAVIAGAPRPLDDVARSAAYLLGRIYEQAGEKEQAID